MKFPLSCCSHVTRKKLDDRPRRSSRVVKLFSSTIALFLTAGCLSVSAAERLVLRVGPLQQAVEIEDLEEFAQTGELSPQLKPYGFLLTPEVRQILNRHLYTDPKLAEQFLDDLLASSDGERLLEQLNRALPQSTTQELENALRQVLQNTREIGVLSFLRAYPDDTIAIDLTSAVGIAMEINLASLQSKLLSPQLEEVLQVETGGSFPLSFDPTKPGNEIVYTDTLVLSDKIRKRTIPVDIYYSLNANAAAPLVIMSHGFAADRRFLQYFAYHLASHGFTVVTIEHPGSNIQALVQMSVGMNLSNLLSASEFVDRPQDITFVLNELESLNRQKEALEKELALQKEALKKEPDLEDDSAGEPITTVDEKNFLPVQFNTDKVSIVGHSFGGYTALAVAGAQLNPKAVRTFCQNLSPLGRAPADWLQCAAAELPYRKLNFRDRRIKSAIALNPIVGNLFGDNLSGIKIPTLMLSSTEDGITPSIPHQLRPFKQLGGDKYLLVAKGATHMSVTDVSYLRGSVGKSTLVKEVMGDEAIPVRQLVRGVGLAFIEQLTPEAEKYQPFLTSAYVQSLSTPTLSMRLATVLPPSLDTWLKVLEWGNQPAIAQQQNTKEAPSFFAQLQDYWRNARRILPQPAYSTGQLENIFTDLLDTYQKQSDRLS